MRCVSLAALRVACGPLLPAAIPIAACRRRARGGGGVQDNDGEIDYKEFLREFGTKPHQLHVMLKERGLDNMKE